MKYRLRTKSRHVDFEDYTAMLAALQPYRGNLDSVILEEIDSTGKVHATLSNAELRQIVAELDGIVLPNVQSMKPKDT